jgi:hypothetical protein
MIWTNKVPISRLPGDATSEPELSSFYIDKAWLDAVNVERKKEQLDSVSYETFEIAMDRLEKDWFDLVLPVSLDRFEIALIPIGSTDQEPPETRLCHAFRRIDLCCLRRLRGRKQ